MNGIPCVFSADDLGLRGAVNAVKGLGRIDICSFEPLLRP